MAHNLLLQELQQVLCLVSSTLDAGSGSPEASLEACNHARSRLTYTVDVLLGAATDDDRGAQAGAAAAGILQPWPTGAAFDQAEGDVVTPSEVARACVALAHALDRRAGELSRALAGAPDVAAAADDDDDGTAEAMCWSSGVPPPSNLGPFSRRGGAMAGPAASAMVHGLLEADGERRGGLGGGGPRRSGGV